MYEELVPSKANCASPQTKVYVDVANGEPPQDVLRKELEDELSAGRQDIRSYSWYHGKVPRDVAENLTINNGDFLVRESVTNVGDYVLTCKYKSAYYHFRINKVSTWKSPAFSSVQYFLEDQHFESLPALVHCYLREKLPVSKKTGVVLGQAVGRAVPISYSNVKYASLRRQPRGNVTGHSRKQYNNNNNKTDMGNGSGLSLQNPVSNSRSSSPFASSAESDDKSTTNPAASSCHQINAVYATPRAPTTELPPRQRQTNDPLPVTPDQGAVVLEEHTVPHSYGRLNQTVTYPGNISSPATNNDSTTTASSHNNGVVSQPFRVRNTTADSTLPVSDLARAARDNRLRISNHLSNRPASQVDMNVEIHGKHVSRSGSDPLLSPMRSRNTSNPHSVNTNSNNSTFQSQVEREGIDSGSQKSKTIPPKPSRIPSFKEPAVRSPIDGENNAGKQFSDRVGPNTETSTVAEVTVLRNSNVNLRSKFSRSKRAQEIAACRRKRASCFKPAQFQCTLLSPENPPLEEQALAEIKSLLLRVDPFKLARHMTVIDCKVCRMMEGELEHILLPHASQLRQDIVERYQCVAFWVAICVIKCTSGREERAEILNKFIQLANELVHSMGNVFGFSAIMHGLTCPQVLSLYSSWESLHLNFTNNAVTFKKKLRPLLQLMDEGKGQIRLGAACIPHIMPMIRLLEYPGSGIPHIWPAESQAKTSASFGSLLDSTSPLGSLGADETSSLNSANRDRSKVDWWENYPNEGFDALLSHLHAGRCFLENVEELKKVANSKLVDFKENPKIREMFTTDFQMRLLFGYRSSELPRQERFHKFDKIITAMLRHIVD